MAEDGERIRVEIAFDGGQIIGALVEPSSADALEQALASGTEDIVLLEAQDGTFHVPPRRIVYYKRFRPGGRVGFGQS
jgi:hypothetical protein